MANSKNYPSTILFSILFMPLVSAAQREIRFYEPDFDSSYCYHMNVVEPFVNVPHYIQFYSLWAKQNAVKEVKKITYDLRDSSKDIWVEKYHRNGFLAKTTHGDIEREYNSKKKKGKVFRVDVKQDSLGQKKKWSFFIDDEGRVTSKIDRGAKIVITYDYINVQPLSMTITKIEKGLKTIDSVLLDSVFYEIYVEDILEQAMNNNNPESIIGAGLKQCRVFSKGDLTIRLFQYPKSIYAIRLQHSQHHGLYQFGDGTELKLLSTYIGVERVNRRLLYFNRFFYNVSENVFINYDVATKRESFISYTFGKIRTVKIPNQQIFYEYK